MNRSLKRQFERGHDLIVFTGSLCAESHVILQTKCKMSDASDAWWSLREHRDWTPVS